MHFSAVYVFRRKQESPKWLFAVTVGRQHGVLSQRGGKGAEKNQPGDRTATAERQARCQKGTQIAAPGYETFYFSFATYIDVQTILIL